MDARHEFCVSAFVETLLEIPVHMQITWLRDSLLVWVGADDRLRALAVAMPSHLPAHEPTSSLLLGGSLQDASEQLAQLLARRTRKQVFASCTLPANAATDLLLPQVLRRIVAELDRGPPAPPGTVSDKPAD